ncbi:MAG: YcaO-like family protein [Desulfobacterales bacterium]|nr:YcaO-like family protein [Desulfobacterales bacterium]
MTVKISLQDALKTSTYDQDKVIRPEETVRRFRSKLEALDLDILDHTARIDNGRLNIPVYFSVCGRDARDIIGNKKQMGKGASPEQAEASAVMELAERFSFFSFFRNPTNFKLGTHADFEAEALPFASVAFSVHDESDDLEAARRVFETIPMRWARAWNLAAEREVLIPFDWFYAINEFNGPSAGNCVEEALSQGLCEIVERHVSSLVSRRRIRVPAIDAASASDPMVREMLGKYAHCGIRLYLQDFSLDMGIPTVGALAYDPSTFPESSEIVWTAGTTPSPEKALSRALTEVAQLAGDFNSGSNYVASGLPKYTRLDQADYLRQPTRTVDLSSMPDLSHANIRLEVERLVSTLSHRGFEPLVIDTTHPDLGVPAFYTIVPGTHFRERAEGTSVGMFAAKLVVEKYPPTAALAELKKFTRLLPDRYYLEFYTGLCHLNSGRPDAALPHFHRALELEPTREDRASIFVYIGVGLKEKEKYREALQMLEKGRAIDDERTDIHNLMGFCYFRLKDHEAAIASFKRVIELDPSSGLDYANIASNYRDLGQRDQAVRFYRLALEIDPSIDFARDNLSRLTADSPSSN